MTESGTPSSTTSSSQASPTATVLLWPAFLASIQRKIRTPLQFAGSCGNARSICIWWQKGLRKMSRKPHCCCILEGWIFRSFITRYWPVRKSSRSLRVWSCWITILHRSWTLHSKGISLGKWSKHQESRWQGRNMVYGLRAQSPKFDWDQGSEERAQGSEEWDQGSQGFWVRIRDHIYYTV